MSLLRDNDTKAKIYMDKPPFAAKPVTQMFTNTAGAGLYIHRDFSTPALSNNVTIKSEKGSEVNVGPIGVQIRNEEGDSISLTAMQAGGGFLSPSYAPRSLNIETVGPHEYKCINSDINMRIIDGGDINIENNSTGLMALGVPAGGLNPVPGIFPFSGNVRLKSRYRNIDLAALGDFSNINIVTKNAKIKLSSKGDVEVHTTGRKVPLVGTPMPATGNIKLTSQLGNIELNALGPTGKVRINGTLGVDIGAAGPVTINSGANILMNGAKILRNGVPADVSIPVTHGGGPTAIPLPPLPIPGVVPPIGPTVPEDGSIPDPQNIPLGGPSLNDYMDGSVIGKGLPGAV